MAYPSLTYRGSTLQTGDQVTYTFSSCDVGAANELRAVLVFIAISTLSGVAPQTGYIDSVTIGGVTATKLNFISNNTNLGMFAYIARVPSGSTADVVVNATITLTRMQITWYTFKPASLTPLDTVNCSASTTADVTFSDIELVDGGVVIVGMLISNGATTSQTITYTGTDSFTTDLNSTLQDGVFYTHTGNIQPTETIGTRDLLYSGASGRRYGVALSFGLQATFQDTLTDAVDVAEDHPAQTTYYPALADEAELLVGIRYTPIQSLEETLSEIVGTAVTITPALSLEIADFIDVSGLVGVPVEDAVADVLHVGSELFNYGWGYAVQDAIGFTENELSYYFVRGVVAEEQIGVGDSTALAVKYVAVVAERAGIRRVLIVALPVTVSDAVGVQYADSVVRGVRVIEGLGLSGQLLNKLTLNKAFTDSVRLSDSLLRFFSGDVVDGFAVTDLLARQRTLNPTLTDTAGVSETLAKQLILRATTAETVQLTHTDVLNMLFRPTLTDVVELAAAYVSPNDTVTTWAINTKNMATTEYTNYAFNSFAQMGSKYLGATSSGLYELNGDDDQGTDIIASIKSGLMQLGGSRFTSFKTAYIGMRGEGNFVLKIETGDGSVYNYAVVGKDMQTSRVHFGKGLRARYFSFELISTGQDFDLDTVEFIPLVVQRRV